MPIAQCTDPDTLARDINEPTFCYHLWCFLEDQPEPKLDITSSPFIYLPDKIYVYSSAVTTFHAPSNLCGTGGMHHEHIHAVASWRHGGPRYNCVFMNTDDLELGMHGLNVACTRLFFSVTMNRVKFPCALVHWFSRVGDFPDKNMGMWVVEPDVWDNGQPWTAMIHLNTIVRLSHLLQG